MMPVTSSAPACTCKHFEYGAASQVWTYRDADGQLLGYIARYDFPNKRKEIIPWTYGGNPARWGMGSWPRARATRAGRSAPEA